MWALSLANSMSECSLHLDNIIFKFRLVNYFLLRLNKGHAISHCMTGLKTVRNVNHPGLSGKSCLTLRNNSPFVNCQYNLMSFLCLLSVLQNAFQSVPMVVHVMMEYVFVQRDGMDNGVQREVSTELNK